MLRTISVTLPESATISHRSLKLPHESVRLPQIPSYERRKCAHSQYMIGHDTRTNQSLQRGTSAQWTEQHSHSALAVLRRRDRRFHLPCAPRLCRGLCGNLLSSVFKSHEKRATLLTLVFHYMHTLPQPNDN